MDVKTHSYIIYTTTPIIGTIRSVTSTTNTFIICIGSSTIISTIMSVKL